MAAIESLVNAINELEQKIVERISTNSSYEDLLEKKKVLTKQLNEVNGLLNDKSKILKG